MPIIQPAQLVIGKTIDVLRLDLIHPIISGNKWFKLKNNLQRAINEGKKSILTFGGAQSNHLAAAAAACKEANIQCIAIVRGEDASIQSETLLAASKAGTHVYPISRDLYNQKNEAHFIETLQEKFGDFYLVPEGGNNAEGILGCMDILEGIDQYDYVFCACGSGATYAGLVASEKTNTKIIGISVLKGENKLVTEVQNQLELMFPEKHFEIHDNKALEENQIHKNCILNNYAFSGFAKFDPFLIDYKREFERQNDFVLDYLYTNKLFYALEDILRKNKLPEHAKMLVIHTGGLQGNAAFEKRYHLL